jgi:phosphate-selective porin OprO/OprP
VYWEYGNSSQAFALKTTHQQREYFNTRAWEVSGSWYLTGEKNAFYTPPAPLHPFHWNGSGLGAWQVTARVGGLALDDAAFWKQADFAAAGAAQNALTWGVGLNWFLNRNIKWILEYDQTSFGFASGYQAASGTVAAQDERVIMTRLQFAF